MPLVVFATGYGGTSMNWAALYDHWVKAGYVVAAPTFPLSRKDAPGGTTGADLASQPGDVAFVTREILERTRRRGSELYGLVDADRVALAGKSFGAITVLEAGYNPADRVANVSAVMALTGMALGGARFEAIDTPLLLEHGDEDALVPLSASQHVYERARSPKFFVTLFGADHLSAFHGGASPPKSLSSERPSTSWIATCWGRPPPWVACSTMAMCPASRRSWPLRSGSSPPAVT